MSSYTTYDFEESIKEVDPQTIDAVLAGWGNVNGEGQCCEECGGEWSGGFLMALSDGRFCYVTGWCDYTGWGCQDGVATTYYDERPRLDQLEKFPESAWDLDPEDCNIAVQKLKAPKVVSDDSDE